MTHPCWNCGAQLQKEPGPHAYYDMDTFHAIFVWEWFCRACDVREAIPVDDQLNVWD